MALLPYTPPESTEGLIWYPINAAQVTALESRAQLLLYGGGSGGGKTDYLVADGAQEITNPNFRGLLLRKSFSEMNNIIDRMKHIYRPLGGHASDGGKLWRFPSGAEMRLGYMSVDSDVEKYQGNPFSWLGVDEAGNQAEHRIRAILPWLSSTDPTLKVRVRLTANPGGVGASWLMKLFLRGVCPVHFPAISVEPGQVYGGARLQWSDGVPLGMTVSFVPALVGDNPLYGEEKVAVLRSQSASVADKLLRGCWCELEGAYFPFLAAQPRIPMASIGVDWWWTHFISIDYGYGNSSAAANLFAVDESGRKYVIDESVQKRMGSMDFAEHLCEKWATVTRGSERRKIACAFIDPANDSQTGTGKSNMQLIADVFERYDISMVKASKDRIGNAQALYRGLSSRDLVICDDTCPKTFLSLTTRMHDDRLGDVKKVHGEDLDDLYDSVSYGFNTWAQETHKPRAVQNAETLARYREDGMDEHSLSVYQMKWAMERDPSEGWMRLRGGRRRFGR